METADRRSGSCFCGAVRYEVTGPAIVVCICHCASCRRITGGAFVPWATYPTDHFTVTAGQLQTLESSAGVTRGHCARCGSSLTYRHAARPQEIDVTLASLGDPPDLPPTFHIWTCDRLPWLAVADRLPQHHQTSVLAAPGYAPK
jgi:hypothetical protein